MKRPLVVVDVTPRPKRSATVLVESVVLVLMIAAAAVLAAETLSITDSFWFGVEVPMPTRALTVSTSKISVPEAFWTLKAVVESEVLRNNAWVATVFSVGVKVVLVRLLSRLVPLTVQVSVL